MQNLYFNNHYKKPVKKKIKITPPLDLEVPHN
jgi:hypothetical protein